MFAMPTCTSETSSPWHGSSVCLVWLDNLDNLDNLREAVLMQISHTLRRQVDILPGVFGDRVLPSPPAESRPTEVNQGLSWGCGTEAALCCCCWGEGARG